LKIVKSNHNHSSTLAETHSTLRKIVMTSKIKNEISRQLTIQIFASKILLNIRISNSIIDVNFSNSENSWVINSMFRSKDIYNFKAKLRREVLNSLIFVQALIRELNENSDDWTYQMRKNEDDCNQITHLFFVKESSRSFLQFNYEMLIMNCIYKTNRFKMFFLIISD
jgi:hypothetical protein